MALSDMASASNERRLQTIMKVRRAFDQQQIVTVASAMRRFGVSRVTMLKYCQDGDIPLIDTHADMGLATVVPVTSANMAAWQK